MTTAPVSEARWRPPSFASHPAKRATHVPMRAICYAVIDGDTLDVLVELALGVYTYERIRIAKVDAPEILHPTSEAERTLGLQTKSAVEGLLLNMPALVDFGSESQVQGRFIASVQYWTGGAAGVWRDLAQYLTEHHLLKSDVA